MITSLRCENFKCFKDTGEIEIAPITILVGENNSGKTSLIQALHLPSLTARSDDPNVCLKLLHEDYDYGTYTDIVYEHENDNNITFTYGASYQPTRRKSGVKPLIKMKVVYGYYPRRKEIYIAEFVVYDEVGEVFRVKPGKYDSPIDVCIRGYEDLSKELRNFFYQRGSVFLPRAPFREIMNKVRSKYGTKKANDIIDVLYFDLNNNILDFLSSFENTHFIGPLRLSPNRTYLYSGEYYSRVGIKGELALQNYTTLATSKKEEDIEIVRKIDNALFKLGFIKDLSIKRISSRHYEFTTTHKNSGLMANLADTGFGASQVLPVLIALYTAPPGSTLLLQQPEIHLHPAAQAVLGSIVIDAISNNRSIIETHSENFILRVLTEVAKGNIDFENVRFYYTKPSKNGHKVISLPINEKGEFAEKWPKGFFEEGYSESVKLAKARQRL